MVTKRQREVFRVVDRRPAELVGRLPRLTPKHGVAEEPNRHPSDPGDMVAGRVGIHFTAGDGLMQRR
jgi:hypothetical protein